ncbi:type II toxin-antitoxin system antitoxin DNA ADP-ribosyl glycohydrolase DarG [Dactylosporangium sp. CA-052675]|uniref:type II toxin-antitoxin system antitoxin DNA ADP-ribosyl glycohydrolase DarG n=1 Tax=Dactylosporangium sp. CA-052675 TaxID=3239927 RepID=UPI003D944B4C
MIQEGRGNLLSADVDALVNTVNTVGVMGKGIALQFKRAFPDNFRAYHEACERGEVRLGRMFVVDRAVLGQHRFIINFPTKRHWRSASRLEDIRTGLDALVESIAEHAIASVAIPALGCGNGGLDWADVRPLIEVACARMPDVRAIIFAPEGAPPPRLMPDATPRPPLTPLRALLLTAIATYLERARLQEVRDGISELEIQKLAYLLQTAGVPYRLSFVPGRYGPYSPDLSRLLTMLEGHHLTGLGDRSARVTELAPINPETRSLEEGAALIGAQPEHLDRLNTVLSLIEGFETPYSLELLATVHFAAIQPPATADFETLKQRVASWSLRKARLFTDAHIRLAADRLADHGFLKVSYAVDA